jgi:general secretion pathway protein E
MTQTVLFSKNDEIGSILINNGKLQQSQLERALAHLATVPQSLGEILVSLGFISEEDLVTTLSQQLSLPLYVPSEEDEFIPFEISKPFHRDHPFVLIRKGEEYKLVVSDPLDSETLSAAEALLPHPFSVTLATESSLRKMVNEQYGLATDDAEEGKLSTSEDDIDKLKDMASEAPVIKYVNRLIDTAVKRKASDIHMEPFENSLLIRLRVDGILHDYEIPPPTMQAAIVSRTKLLAALDIAERRLPQDGKIGMRISGKEIDLRVSTMPTVYGEGVVIRILEKGSIILQMAHLGMSSVTEERFRKLITLPHGIILVTGPTGSGKTTTLYCALNQINSGENKIITIEDPVEYQLHGINQIQVRPEIGLTFARGLRSIVRQDPDIIMIGEIRDLDTAEIAVQSSLTGHLVFSTLHTNDAVSAVTRMVDIGVERFLVSASLRAVLAQRLVRRICPHCRTSRGFLSETGLRLEDGNDFEIFKGAGCSECSNTGYSGRVGLYELLVVTDTISRAISQGRDQLEIKKIAEGEGFQPMLVDGIQKAKAGLTTISEILRVCQGSEDDIV